jgi:ankyrin repeat protein
LILAAHNKDHAMARLLIKAGADVNALDIERYDVISISSVADDTEMIRIALAAGGKADLITSPYNGTAPIASAHLGRVEVVNILIAAKAPLDHVNNLGWTALIEAIVLGDGGPDYTAIVDALIKAGADVNIADRQGATPLTLARSRGYEAMARLIEAAEGRE